MLYSFNSLTLVNGVSIFVYLFLYYLMELAPLESMAMYAGIQVFWTFLVLTMTIPPAIMVHEKIIRKSCPKCKRKRQTAPN